MLWAVLYSGIVGDLVMTSAGLAYDFTVSIGRGGVLKILSDILVVVLFLIGDALLSGLPVMYLLTLVCKALNLMAISL